MTTLSRKPKISVIIRTYNSEKFVKRAIRSALNQTLDKNNYEILVVDDGSYDGTMDILKKYADKIRIIEQGHLGPKIGVKTGIKESRGNHVIFLDADDQFKPDTLKKMLSAFDDKSIDFVYCDYFEKKGKTIKRISLAKNIFNNLWCNIMFKKKLFKEIGLPSRKLFFAEYDFLIKLMRAGKKGKYFKYPLYVYNRSQNSLTSIKEMVEMGINQLKKKYGKIADKIRKY
jgi:glycosyltransferase involved in cell wall biosynthesis